MKRENFWIRYRLNTVVAMLVYWYFAYLTFATDSAFASNIFFFYTWMFTTITLIANTLLFTAAVISKENENVRTVVKKFSQDHYKKPIVFRTLFTLSTFSMIALLAGYSYLVLATLMLNVQILYQLIVHTGKVMEDDDIVC